MSDRLGTVAVLGAGGVGGFVAAALARAGTPTTIVAREPTASVIAERGISVSSVALGSFQVCPRAVTVLEDSPAALIVATKALGLDEALGRIRGEPALVVPLLNGVEHVAALRARFGTDRVTAAVIRVQSERTEPGAIEQRSPAARIDIAPPPAAIEGPVVELTGILEASGIEVRAGGSEADVMWGKLARLCPLALATSAHDSRLGPLRDDPARWAELLSAIEEVVAVAVAEGAGLDVSGPTGELQTAQPDLDSSMHRDLAEGRDTELDAIAGAVMRAAARHGLSCPTVSALAAAVCERSNAGRAAAG